MQGDTSCSYSAIQSNDISIPFCCYLDAHITNSFLCIYQLCGARDVVIASKNKIICVSGFWPGEWCRGIIMREHFKGMDKPTSKYVRIYCEMIKYEGRYMIRLFPSNILSRNHSKPHGPQWRNLTISLPHHTSA